jgi:hypothetical protein
MSAQWTDELDRHRFNRAGAWLLLFVGITGAAIGSWYMRDQVLHAFQNDVGEFKTSEEVEQERIAGLKDKDTDTDGISDYDETYVFKTSPYLEDSDSDGLADKQELSTGKNPNCPEGKDCGVLITGTGSATTTAGSDVEAQFIEQLLNPTADQVRQFLRDAGVKEEEIQGIDDATLMQMYKASLLEAQANQAEQ